jgi:hypothetical protein
MLRHTLVVVALSGVVGGLWVSACSVDVNGAAPVPEDASADADAAIMADGTADTTVPEDVVEPKEATIEAAASGDAGDGGTEAESPTCNASNCGGACCGNQCVPRTCAGCATGPTFCPYSLSASSSNGTCVSDCSACNPGDASPLFSCASCAAGSPVVTCAASPTQCPAALAAGACPCSQADSGAVTCPVATQICLVPTTGPSTCLTCGQPGTQGQSCGNGKICVEAKALCEAVP